MIPITVRQAMKSVTSDGQCLVDGRDPHHVKLVACIQASITAYQVKVRGRRGGRRGGSESKRNGGRCESHKDPRSCHTQACSSSRLSCSDPLLHPSIHSL